MCGEGGRAGEIVEASDGERAQEWRGLADLLVGVVVAAVERQVLDEAAPEAKLPPVLEAGLGVDRPRLAVGLEQRALSPFERLERTDVLVRGRVARECALHRDQLAARIALAKQPVRIDHARPIVVGIRQDLRQEVFGLAHSPSINCVGSSGH